MLRLIDVAQNWHILLSEGQDEEGNKVFAEVEASLTVFEKRLELVGTRMINVEKLETIRIGLNLESAKIMQNAANMWVEELEKKQAIARKAFPLTPSKKQKTLAVE